MANKKKKRSGGQEAHALKQQRIEERRRERAEQEAKQRKAAARAGLVRGAALIALAALAVWFVFFRGQTPDEIGGHELTKFSGGGVGEHAEGTLDYEMSPPVEGTHATSPAACGVHGTAIPNENLVHSLEHGAVGLMFSPDASPDDITALEDLALEFDENVLSAPFSGMESPFSVISWGERMDLAELDVDAMREYIDVFAGKGPEAGQTCPSTTDSPFDPEA